MGTLAFWLIARNTFEVNDLEIFAEELEFDKNRILPFKQAVYTELERLGLQCTPPNMQKYNQDFPINKFDAETFGIECKLHFEYYYTHQKPRELAQFIQNVWAFIIRSYHHSEFGQSFFINLELDADDDLELMQFLLNDKLFSFGAWWVVTSILDDFVRAHNIPWDIMREFKQTVKVELERISGKPLIPALEKIIALLETANIQKDLPLIKQSLLGIHAHFINLFEQNDPEKMANFLYTIARLIVKKIELPIVDLLKQHFNVSQASLKKIGNLIKQQDLRAIASSILDQIHFSSIARDRNIQVQEHWQFKKAVFEAINRLIPTTSLIPTSVPESSIANVEIKERKASENTIHSIENSTFAIPIPSLVTANVDKQVVASRSLVKEEQHLSIIKEIQRQLTIAFKLKDKALYKDTVQKIVELAKLMFNKGNLPEFIAAFDITLPFIAPMVAALESNTPKDIIQFIIDYTLRIEINKEEFPYLGNLYNWFKTQSKRTKATQAREKTCLDFQKSLYQLFNLDISPEKMGILFKHQYRSNTNLYDASGFNLALVLKTPDPTEPKLDLVSKQDNAAKKPKQLEDILKLLLEAIQSKNHIGIRAAVVDIRNLLKKAFLDRDEIEFAKVLINLLKCIQFMHKEKNIGCLALTLNVLTLNEYFDREIEECYPTILITEFLFFLKLLDKKINSAQIFVLLNFIKFLSFATCHTEFDANIAVFKVKVLSELIPTPLLFSDEEVGQFLELTHQFNLDQMDEIEFTRLLLDLYEKDLILRAMVPGNKKRKSHKKLVDLLSSEVQFIRKASQILSDIVGSSLKLPLSDIDVGYRITSSILKRQEGLVLHWLIINDSEQIQFISQNGISADKLYDLKSSLYEAVTKDQTLLRSVEELRQSLKTYTVQETDSIPNQPLDSKTDIQTNASPAHIRSVIFEIKLLLRESFQAGEIDEFAKGLAFLVEVIKNHISDPTVISNLLHIEGEKLKAFSNILKQEKFDLAIHYLLNHLKLTHWQSDNNLTYAQTLTFYLGVLKYFERRGRNLLPQNAEVLLQSNIDKAKDLTQSNPYILPIQTEIEFMLQDAYLRNDTKIFAETIDSVRKFMNQLFSQGKIQALIQLFDMNATLYDENTGKKSLHNHLTVEDVFLRLFAKDQDGLAKVLIDYFIKECRKHFLSYQAFVQKPLAVDLAPILEESSTKKAYSNEAEFAQAIYQALNINPLDFFSPESLDLNQDAELIATTIKTMANKGLDLQKYENTLTFLAKYPEIHQCLIPPSPSDSAQYKKLYNRLQKIWIEHLIVHRFGIINERLEGSYSSIMLKELSRTGAIFSHTDKFKLILNDVKRELKGVTDEAWAKTLQHIASDPNDIFLLDDGEKILKKLNEQRLIAIPARLRSEESGDEVWGHRIGVIFFHYKGSYYCMLTDRSGIISENHFGLQTFKIRNSKQLLNVARSIIGSIQLPITVKGLHAMLTPLELGNSPFHIIPKKRQKNGNCTWGSAAKMLDFGIKFVNLLQAIGSIRSEISNIVDDFGFAVMLTQPLYKGYTNSDRFEILLEYFNACAQYEFEADPLILAQILIKSEERKQRLDIVQMIQSKGIIKPEHREQAKLALLKNAESLIIDSLGLEHRMLDVDNKLLKEHANKVLEAYIKNKPEVEITQLIEAAVKAIKERQPDLFKPKPIIYSNRSSANAVASPPPMQRDARPNVLS